MTQSTFSQPPETLNHFPGERAIISGVTRSGTSILGKLIATLDRIEYAFEPWPVTLLAVAQHHGAAEAGFASQQIRKYSYSLLAQHILGRNVNLRPTDDSCILNNLSRDELEYRWNTLKTRAEVNHYINHRKSLFVLKLPNLEPYFSFLMDALTPCRLIYPIRNGIDVALSLTEKGWFRDQSLLSIESLALSKTMITSRHPKGFRVPFFIGDEDAELFHTSTLFARSLLAWCILMEHYSAYKKAHTGRILEIYYEKFVAEPKKNLESICDFLNTQPGSMTNQVLQMINPKKAAGARLYPAHELPDAIVMRANKLLHLHQYAPIAKQP